MSTEGDKATTAPAAGAKDGSSLKPPPITTSTTVTTFTANGGASSSSSSSTDASAASTPSSAVSTPKKSLSAAAPAFKPSGLRAAAREFVPGGSFKPGGSPSLPPSRGPSPVAVPTGPPQSAPPASSGGGAKAPRGPPASPPAYRGTPPKSGTGPYGSMAGPKGGGLPHPMAMHYGGMPPPQFVPGGQPMPYHPAYPPQYQYPPAMGGPPHGGGHPPPPHHKGKGHKGGGQQQHHPRQQQQSQPQQQPAQQNDKGGEAAAAAAGGKQQQANSMQKPQAASPETATARVTPDSSGGQQPQQQKAKAKEVDSSDTGAAAASAAPAKQQQPNGEASAAVVKADSATAPVSTVAPTEAPKEAANGPSSSTPPEPAAAPSPAPAPAPAPAPWRRGMNVPERAGASSSSSGPVAPVPVKAQSRASTAAEWEEVITSLPAVPDAPAVEGVRQYHARELLQIRRKVVEALPPGSAAPKPEGCVDIPAEILSTDPPGPSPVPLPAPSPAPETAATPRSRTPKVPDGLPRPRSSNLGLDDTSGSGGRGGSGGGGGGGRNTPRSGGGDQEVPSFGRQKSGGKKGGGGRGGRGGFRDGTPPPLEDADGYAPKRIAEEMRWRPESIALRRAVDPEDPEKKIKRARAILNKLSLEKFDKLSGEFIAVGFTSEILLWRAIDIIVAKAQEEVHFSAMYAELCLRLSRTPFEGLGEEGKGKMFRKALLIACQEEFEKTLEQRQAAVEADASVPAEEKAEKKRIAKFRYLGHMRFIGELFLKELLKEEVVHECIKYLFGEEDSPDEEGLECLCKLLATTGRKLELLAAANTDESAGKKQRKQMQRYFNEVKRLSEAKELLSSRTRCLLKDLCELRQNDYVPRRAVETAKTLSQVHEEIAREEQAKAKSGGGGGGGSGGQPRLSSRTSSSSRLGESGGSSQDVRREGSVGGSSSRQSSSASLAASSTVDDDGWETVGPKKASSMAKSASRTSLVRSGSAASLGGGDRGSMKKASSSSSFGAFAALQEREREKKREKKERKEEKKEKKESKRSGGTKKERVDEQPPAAESPSSSSASATPAPSATTPEAPAAEAEADASSSSTVDTKEVLRKGRSILGDFLETRDAKDAQEAMAELGLSEKEGELAGRLVGAWLEDALQRKGEQMALLADLVVALHEAMLLGPGAIETGLRPTLEGLADLRVDVPKLEEWLASALARMVEGGALLLGFLQAAPQQMVEDGVAASFAAKVIEQLQGRVGQERAKEMVAAAKIDLKPLVGPDAEDAEAEVAALMEKLALV